jgi:hypothetical protein
MIDDFANAICPVQEFSRAAPLKEQKHSSRVLGSGTVVNSTLPKS